MYPEAGVEQTNKCAAAQRDRSEPRRWGKNVAGCERVCRAAYGTRGAQKRADDRDANLDSSPSWYIQVCRSTLFGIPTCALRPLSYVCSSVSSVWLSVHVGRSSVMLSAPYDPGDRSAYMHIEVAISGSSWMRCHGGAGWNGGSTFNVRRFEPLVKRCIVAFIVRGPNGGFNDRDGGVVLPRGAVFRDLVQLGKVALRVQRFYGVVPPGVEHESSSDQFQHVIKRPVPDRLSASTGEHHRRVAAVCD